MLVSFLASVVVGQLDSVPCDIVGYEYRFTTGNKEECCNYAWSDCYTGANYCSVSHHYHCCGLNEINGQPAVSCLDKTKAECDALTGYKWCGSDPPAEPADLDGATVGTIVVASLIGVALVGGAIAVHLEV